MRKRYLVIGIVFLLIIMSFNPSSAFDNLVSNGNIFYVGGSGPGNHTRIQDAINNTSDGDTVFVYDDSSPYYEHVIIDKSITLMGEDRNTVIINGSGTGEIVYCNTSNVTICGFTIQNSGNESEENAGIFLDNSDDDTITGNIITNNVCGICCYTGLSDSSDYHNISKNIITNNTRGIYLDFSFKNEVYENYIEDNKFGIEVGSSSHPSKNIDNLRDMVYNNIYRNNITKNEHGIYLDIAFYNNIFENNITNNNYGIHLVPPYLCPCSINSIYQNNINNNTYGIFAEADGGSVIANTISRNNIMYNAEGITFLLYDYDYGFNYVVTRNKILYNNFIGNNNTVYFKYSLFNLWIGNYWGKPRLLPYPFFGQLKFRGHIFSWIAFDWYPAKEPYDI